MLKLSAWSLVCKYLCTLLISDLVHLSVVYLSSVTKIQPFHLSTTLLLTPHGITTISHHRLEQSSLNLFCFPTDPLTPRASATQQPEQYHYSRNWSHHSVAQTFQSPLKFPRMLKSWTGPHNPQSTATTKSDFISYYCALILAATTLASLHHKAPRRLGFYPLGLRNPSPNSGLADSHLCIQTWALNGCILSAIHCSTACLPSTPNLSHLPCFLSTDGADVLLLLIVYDQSLSNSAPEEHESLMCPEH